MRFAPLLAVLPLTLGACAVEHAARASAPTLETLRDELVALERASWVAWKGRDGAFFEQFLSGDHVDIGPRGIIGKEEVIAGVRSPGCVVQSYSVSAFRVTRIAADSALLTYRAEQKTTCGGYTVPSPAWATSVYAKRGGRWVNVSYQQTPAR